jgi:Holliday junction resolvase
MMTTRSVTTDDRLLEEVAENYRQRGYRVIIAPSSKQLPVFLRAYRPDIVAESSDESVVVEVKPHGTAPEQTDWGELAKTVQQHPGWRLELVVGSDLDRSENLVIDQREIEARLQEGLQLSNANMFEAALLITWSASEAAMRWVCKKQKVDLPDFRPATLITRLYTDGIIAREEYDQLMRFMHMRNAVAHGLRQDGVDAEAIEQLHHLALRLLRSA